MRDKVLILVCSGLLFVTMFVSFAYVDSNNSIQDFTCPVNSPVMIGFRDKKPLCAEIQVNTDDEGFKVSSFVSLGDVPEIEFFISKKK